MRVRVDQKLCQGHTLCAVAAPAIFHIRDEDGQAFADDGPVPAAEEPAARDAVAGCPEMAIIIDEE